MDRRTYAFIAILLVGCSSSKPPEQSATKTENPAEAGVGSIVRLDPALDALVPASAKIEKLATGFGFTEGPLWFPEGYLWFSDVTGNVVRQWGPDGKVTEVLRPGGGENTTAPAGSFIGPNGMIHDKDGNVLLCQHSNRQIVRVTKDHQVSPFLSKFEGKRFNSPNDLVYRSDGSLYFTDPPYGLLKQRYRRPRWRNLEVQWRFPLRERQSAGRYQGSDSAQRNCILA